MGLKVTWKSSIYDLTDVKGCFIGFYIIDFVMSIKKMKIIML